MFTACGGGGGEGGDSPQARRGAFTLSALNAAFTAKRLGAPPTPQTLTLQVTGSDVAAVGAVYRNGVTPAAWLTVSITGTHPTYSVGFSVSTTNLPAGIATTTVSVGTADVGGNLLEYKDVAVSYTLNEGVVIVSAVSDVNATLGHSTNSFAKTLSVSAIGKQWQITSDVPWVTATASTSTGSGTVAVTINTSTLPVGSHRATVTAVNTADSSDRSAVAFNTIVTAPTWTLSSPTLEFGGVSGLDMSARQLSASLGTGAKSHPWTATFTPTSGGNWLQADLTAGNASAAATVIGLQPVAGNLAKGTYAGQLRLTVTVQGVNITADVPATLRVDEQRLWASANGVAFASFPGRSVLTRSLRIFNSQKRDIAWAASSDQSWLSVTPSGSGEEALTLTATPGSLAAGELHVATVTVSSGDARIVNDESIRVGLWIGEDDPQDLTLSVAARYIVANPVEPLVFAHNGGTSISVYDVYTGELVRTLNVGTNMGPMTFSSDGVTLFAVNANEQEALAINPTTGAVIRTYAYTAAHFSDSELGEIAYARPSGYPLLLSGSIGDVFDVASGARFSARLLGDGHIAVSKDGQRVYLQEMVTIRTPWYFNELRYSTLDSAGVSILRSFEKTSSLSVVNGQDLALSHDDSRLYRAIGSPPGFEVASPDTLATIEYLSVERFPAYPGSFECSWRGWCLGAVGPLGAPQNIWIYDEEGESIGGLHAGDGAPGLWQAQMVLSGDNMRVVTALDPTGLSLLTVPE
jgi:hypothetical protein